MERLPQGVEPLLFQMSHQQGGDGQSQQVQSDAMMTWLIAQRTDGMPWRQADDHAAHHAQQEAEKRSR